MGWPARPARSLGRPVDSRRAGRADVVSRDTGVVRDRSRRPAMGGSGWNASSFEAARSRFRRRRDRAGRLACPALGAWLRGDESHPSGNEWTAQWMAESRQLDPLFKFCVGLGLAVRGEERAAEVPHPLDVADAGMGTPGPLRCQPAGGASTTSMEHCQRTEGDAGQGHRRGHPRIASGRSRARWDRVRGPIPPRPPEPPRWPTPRARGYGLTDSSAILPAGSTSGPGSFGPT
jgi:hypothetical protein